jgi:hypothetical protein
MIKKQLKNIWVAIDSGYRVWLSNKATKQLSHIMPNGYKMYKWVNTPTIKIINPLGKRLAIGKNGIYQLMIKRKRYKIDAYQCLHFSLWIDQIDPDTQDSIEQAYLGYRDKAKVYYRDDSTCKKQTQQNFDMDCPF